MERNSIDGLRLDKRLRGRKGWISQSELDKELSALPDVTDKIAPPEETPEEHDPDQADKS